MMRQRIILTAVLLAISSFIFYFESTKVALKPSNVAESEITPRTHKTKKAEQYIFAKEISSPDGFINTKGITIEELIGKKVILVDFWTYSCINCQRTTPYLNAWYKKYRNQGLEIIGLHTPEFEFEKEYDNVLKAVKKFNIEYPVVLDNDFSTWQAYKNRYWPRKYLIDIDGFIVYDHIGEGGYEETEAEIQKALLERALVLGSSAKLDRETTQLDDITVVDFSVARTPEIYFGAARNKTYLGNGKASTTGKQFFVVPLNFLPDALYLDRAWRVEEEFAETQDGPTKIVITYTAKNVYFVAGSEEEINVQVVQDGRPIEGIARGADLTEGVAVVREHKLYHLVSNPEVEERTLELIIDTPGLKAFTFTFG